MAIKITILGGVFPAALPRALPDVGAQKAQNLLARTTEFRPLLTDVAAATSAVSNPKTLYRLSRRADGTLNSDHSTGWITNAGHVNYVRGQIDDDLSERTYYTYADGSQPPRARNALGEDRKLGVPAPSQAPVATLVDVDELSTADLPDVQAASELAVSNLVKASFVTSYQGNSIPPNAPSPGSIGWVGHGNAQMPSTSLAQWNFLIPMSGASTVAGYEYLMDPAFGGKQVTLSAFNYWAIPVELYAAVQTINPVTLSAGLTALTISQVGGVPAEAGLVFTPAEVASIVSDTVAFYALDQQPQKALVDKALAATGTIRNILDGIEAGAFEVALYDSPAFVSGLARLIGITASQHPSQPSYGVTTAKIYTRAAVLAGNPIITGYSGITFWNPNTPPAGTVAIRAAINASITTAAGVRSLDIVRLKQILQEEYTAIISFVSDASRKATLLSQLDYYCDYDTQELANFFSNPSLIALDPTGSNIPGALRRAIDTAKVALSSLASIYSQRVAQAPQVGINAYALGPRANIAASAIERIVGTRFYITTYVTDWDEESAPSRVSEIITEMDQNDLATVAAQAPPSGRNIAGWLLYRSNVGSAGAAFKLVVDADAPGAVLNSNGDFKYFSIAALTYTDRKLSSELQEACPTTTWLEPPPTLAGLVSMANGVMAGFVDNYVAFCESYFPYAWPVEYHITTEAPIVVLGSFAQTLVVMHHAGVDFISGADAASMSQQRGVSLQTCTAPRSVVSVEDGVVYASPDGLCYASANGVRLLTANHFTREDWQALDPSSMVGAYHEQTYYFLHGGAIPGCYAFHAETGKLTTVGVSGSAFYSDRRTDTLFAVSGTSISALFSGATHRTGLWRSKLIVIPRQLPMAWLVVESDFTEGPVTVRWYGDGALRHTVTLTSRTPVRLPPGRYIEHALEIESQSRWNAITIASSTEELQAA
jgi:hypothetical protein